MEKKFAVCLATVLVSLGGVLAQSDYVKAVEQWRRDRETDLKKEDGWLTLAGLFWLKDGVNTVGAGPRFDVRLTDSFKQGDVWRDRLQERGGDVAGGQRRRGAVRRQAGFDDRPRFR